jgi:hypothetical protein
VTIETDLITNVSSLFGDRFFADTAPSTSARPFCIYQQVGGTPISGFCGDFIAKRNAVIQFWVWAATRESANTLMHSLHSTLTAAPFRATSQGGLSAEYNEVTRAYGAVQRFSFWA